MNLPCEVIRDLLPLYRDGVCGETSRHFVSGHLQNCAACRQELAGLEAALAQPAPADEAAALKAVARALEKKRRKVMWRSILAAVLIVALSLGGYALLWQMVLPVSGEKLRVEECMQLSDGRLVFRFESSDPRRVTHVLYENENGVQYIIPKVRFLGQRVSRFPEIGNFDDYIAIDLEGSGQPVTEVRLGTSRDSVLVWQSGMELPAAGAAVEELIARHDAALMPPDTWDVFSYPNAELLPPAEGSASYFVYGAQPPSYQSSGAELPPAAEYGDLSE